MIQVCFKSTFKMQKDTIGLKAIRSINDFVSMVISPLIYIERIKAIKRITMVKINRHRVTSENRDQMCVAQQRVKVHNGGLPATSVVEIRLDNPHSPSGKLDLSEPVL